MTVDLMESHLELYLAIMMAYPRVSSLAKLRVSMMVKMMEYHLELPTEVVMEIEMVPY